MLSPLSFLADELQQNKITVDLPELIKYPAVLTELNYALSPVIHEGKLQPYGFIVMETINSPSSNNSPAQLSIPLSEARRVADGCHAFSIFRDGQFQGLFFPKYASYTELQLLQLQQELQASICVTDTSGVTKLFGSSGLFIHQYRSWQKKPCISSAWHNICRCVPQVHGDILKNLLEFCFHDLSPRKIGATLVWCLQEPTAQEWENMDPPFRLPPIEAGVGSAATGISNPNRSSALLRHLLTYTDGAVILDTQARAIGVGAHLKYSETSKRLIEARAGTRHTSAQRFSYDFAKGIIFVVSSDGPVTVFSDGMGVTGLEVRFTAEPEAESEATNSSETQPLFSCSNEVICPVCLKHLKIEEADDGQFNKEEKSLYCPVCNHFLYSARCNNLHVSVMKSWQLNSTA